MKKNIIPILFFILYFFVGVFVFRDYGVSWDELYQDAIGQFNMRYVTRMDTHLLDETNTAKFAAPLYEMFVVGTARAFGINAQNFIAVDQRSMHYRHFLNFSTFFIGVIFFYLLCQHRFKNKYMGLLGAIFLILTPRLFADEFYNSKDTVFLAFFVITFYFLMRFFEKKSLGRLIRLAILTGITFGVRVGVIFIPFFAALCCIGDYFFTKGRGTYKKDVWFLIVYGCITLSLIFATYPVLWSNPIQNFTSLLQFFNRQPNNVPNLYFGSYVPAFEIPWHFIPVWISITTPPVYIILFLTGLVGLFLGLKKNIKQFYLTRREDLLVLLWFFVPLISVIIGHSVLYNSWRHMFFIYPAFIIIAIHGVLYIQHLAQKYIKRFNVFPVLIGFLFVTFVYVAWMMISLHPYEHLYFNFLAGNDMKIIRQQFDTDYWGLTYREGLEYLLRYDQKSSQVVVVADFPGHSNAYILSQKDQQRIFAGFPWDIHDQKPKYFMTNFFFSQKEFPYKEIYAVNVKGADILRVYELPESANIRFDGKFIYR